GRAARCARRPHPRVDAGADPRRLAPDGQDDVLHHALGGGGALPRHGPHRDDAAPGTDLAPLPPGLRPPLHRRPPCAPGELRPGLHRGARGSAGGDPAALAARRGGGVSAQPGGGRAPAPRTSRFSTPGEGPTTAISAATMAGILLLWWLASHFQWVPPLFL